MHGAGSSGFVRRRNCYGRAGSADREGPQTFVKELRPSAKVVMLDAAAPHAGELPEREDIFRDTDGSTGFFRRGCA
jgi:hypothetical protein